MSSHDKNRPIREQEEVDLRKIAEIERAKEQQRRKEQEDDQRSKQENKQ